MGPHVTMQETLADRIVLARLLAHPRRACSRAWPPTKPDVYPDCDAVSVEVTEPSSAMRDEPRMNALHDTAAVKKAAFCTRSTS